MLDTPPCARRCCTTTDKSSTSCAPSVTHLPSERPEPCSRTQQQGIHLYYKAESAHVRTRAHPLVTVNPLVAVSNLRSLSTTAVCLALPSPRHSQ
jgi:hypothetical protein